ncbi:MAG TPA: hypothetical protein VIG79_03085 [Lapillicoccus sp.]|uniref:hypothetical protein n=1 Tax=Lapillicoccus sp. TaxID=1909287 RepID=UPI002F91DC00
MDERASASEICLYYARVLRERLLDSGRVSFYPNCDYIGEGRFVSQVSGPQFEVRGRRRIVSAHYLSPMIPATSPPPFGVAEGVRVLPVNDLVDLVDLVDLDEAPSQYVVAGSGKTATDACIWLLDRGVDPEAIVWVRPRYPWMINRGRPAGSGGVLDHRGRDHGGSGGGRLSRRSVLPHGRGRGDGADRPIHDSDDGQDRHVGPTGSWIDSAPSSGSSGSATSCTSSPDG